MAKTTPETDPMDASARIDQLIAGLDGDARRVVDFFEGDEIDEPALNALIRAAIEYNHGKSKKKR